MLMKHATINFDPNQGRYVIKYSDTYLKCERCPAPCCQNAERVDFETCEFWGESVKYEVAIVGTRLALFAVEHLWYYWNGQYTGKHCA